MNKNEMISKFNVNVFFVEKMNTVLTYFEIHVILRAYIEISDNIMLLML